MVKMVKGKAVNGPGGAELITFATFVRKSVYGCTTCAPLVRDLSADPEWIRLTLARVFRDRCVNPP